MYCSELMSGKSNSGKTEKYLAMHVLVKWTDVIAMK